MQEQYKKIYVGIDIIKLICAILVVFMHTYCYDGGVVGDWIKNVLASVAVPFFFIVSGFFYTKGLEKAEESKNYFLCYMLRVTKMYITWTIVTLPVAWLVLEYK